MPSGYPGALDSLSTTHADGVNEIIHAATINDLADAINKVEAELGVLPKGTYGSVAARLAALGVQASRIDLVGHSIAGGGGAVGTNFEMGWVDKLVGLFGARLRDGSKGGSMASMQEGGQMYTGDAFHYSGYGRTFTDFPMQDQIGPMLPFLPMSEVAIVWHITNDIGWAGPGAMTSIIEALRSEVSRFLAAHVFEDTAAAQLGYTPVAYSGSTAWIGSFSAGVASNADFHYQSVAYTGVNNNKITIQVPADLYGGGIIQLGFLAGSSSHYDAVWEVHDVTSGDTLLATYDLRNLGTEAAGTGNGAIASIRSLLGVTRRLSLAAGPATTIAGEQWTTNGTLTVPDTSAFATSGVLRIHNTLISYTGKTATTFTGCTTASGYAFLAPNGEPVYGSRNLELRPTIISSGSLAIFDFWAIEAPSPGLVAIPLMYKPDNYGIWATWPYGQTGSTLAADVAAGATTLTLNTATVTNAMTTSGNIGAVTGGAAFWRTFQMVRIDNEAIYASFLSATTMTSATRGALGSTAATHAAGATVLPYVRAGDHITIGLGTAAQETLTVLSVAGATITLTAPTANAHVAGDRVLAGYQDADVDAQNAAAVALAAEFPSTVFTVPVDDLVNGTGQPAWSYFIGDGVHPNDLLHAKLAKRLYDYIVPRLTVDLAVNASPADVGPWGGDSQYQMMTLNTHWTAYSTNWVKVAPTGTYNPRFKKDMASGLVTMEGAVVCDALANIGTVIFTLPQGARPGYDITRVIPTVNGPAIVAIKATGDVQLVSGGSLGYTELAFSFLAEG